MGGIALVAPNDEVYRTAREVVQEMHCDVHVFMGALQEGVKAAQKAVRAGAEAIISRGGTAALIQRSGIEVPVIEMQVTGYDIIRALHTARQFGREVGIVGFINLIRRVESIDDILEIHIRKIVVEAGHEFEPKIREAVGSGVSVVVGGLSAVTAAQRCGIPGVLVAAGKSSVVEAIEEAKRVVLANKRDRERTERLRAVLHFISAGVVAVDRNGVITEINPVASKIAGVSAKDAVGKLVTDVIPDARLENVLTSTNAEIGELQEIRGTRVVTNKVPIVTNGEVVGLVATFEDITRIQKAEWKIRQQLLAKGHVARYRFTDILGNSPAIRTAIRKASLFARVDSTIVIEAETGTGKEVFAQSIHAASRRGTGPFVAVNCAALPETLLESELFGYVSGAFTGADRKGKPGLFEIAHGGTIFLDEVSEMSVGVQARLLRVLQEKEVMRIGDDRVIPVDIRVIAATNRDLDELVKSGQFRKDLYYRLNVLNLRIPPLRHRLEDIPVLANHFAAKICQRLGRPQVEFSPEAMEALMAFDWPGNVRQLENVVERLVVLAADCRVDADDVQEALNVPVGKDCVPKSAGDLGRNGILSEMEKCAILQVLREVNGNRAEAARRLGISKTTLWRRLRQMAR